MEILVPPLLCFVAGEGVYEARMFLHRKTLTSFMYSKVSFCLHSWCQLKRYQTLEHWYQPGEHQTACQPETE